MPIYLQYLFHGAAIFHDKQLAIYLLITYFEIQ